MRPTTNTLHLPIFDYVNKVVKRKQQDITIVCEPYFCSAKPQNFCMYVTSDLNKFEIFPNKTLSFSYVRI